MILRKLFLENFGLYAGATTIDLAPRSKRSRRSPIVLIGGKNGSGKTTILEAVRLALYGKRALGASVGQVEYERYLRNKIHQSSTAAVTPRGAAVGLEFDFAELGVRNRYRVRRSWQTRGKSVAEELVIEQNDGILTDVRRSEWQEFLQDLIPPGVSQLFFFDGEKIQELAEGEDDRQHLASAVRSLLGLDLVGRLRDDLSLYLVRQTTTSKAAFLDRLQGIEQAIAASDERVSVLSHQLGQVRSDKTGLSRKADRLRTRIISKGGAFADLQQLKEEYHDVREEIATLENEIRHAANDLLPLAIAPKLLSDFQNWLERQGQAFDRQTAATNVILDVIAWREAEEPRRLAKWTEEHWQDLDQFLDSWSNVPTELPGSVYSFDVARYQTLILKALHQTAPKATHNAQCLDALTARRDELGRLISRAEASGAEPQLDELRAVDHELGALEGNIAQLSSEVSKAQAEGTRLRREQERLERTLRDTEQADRRSSLAANAARALEDYQLELTSSRIRQLQDEFRSCFNRLARKGDVLSAVIIDPETLDVHLTDTAGANLKKSQLSAGEKQIYAISMLWALARTSGRPLPMLIDTPLARLDADHRANLLERYFPAVSHQVIMLSTDTEVDEHYFALLRPFVSHAIHLRYDRSESRTVAERGYFWSEWQREPEHALQKA